MFKHVVDKYGRHSIIQMSSNGDVHEGDLVSYQNYASLRVGGKTVIAVTEYFSGGVLVPGVIYRVQEDV